MPTPNFDILHLRLARRVKDTVAAAGTAGEIYSVANRSDYLNQANTYLVAHYWHNDPSFDKNLTRSRFMNLVKTLAVSFSSSGTNLPADYNNMWLGLTKTVTPNGATVEIFTFRPTKQELDANVNPFRSSLWTIEGAKIYAYEDGVVLNTGSGTFFYLLKDEVTQGGATDIAIGTKWWDVIVDLAASFALSEKTQTSLNPQAFFARAEERIKLQ